MQPGLACDGMTEWPSGRALEEHITSPGSTANWGEAAVRAKARVPSRTAGATQPATGEPAVRLRVLYADTDAGGVVYDGSYPRPGLSRSAPRGAYFHA
jgi:hypothetical protein